jgi:hypothetical protein
MSVSFDRDPYFTAPIPERRPPAPFRLIELLAIIGGIILLVGLFLREWSSTREFTGWGQCVNNLKQISLALHNYEQAYGVLPPASTFDRNGSPLHSWRTLIMPYLGATQLYSTIDLSRPWNDPANSTAYRTSLGVFHCPSAPRPTTLTTYLAVVGPNACFLPDRPRRLAEITDPHSQTIAVIEVDKAHAVHRMAPTDADDSLVLSLGQGSSSKGYHYGGLSHAGFNSAILDGSARLLYPKLSARIRRALVSIAGGDSVSPDEW